MEGQEEGGGGVRKESFTHPPLRTLEVTPTFLIVNDEDAAFDEFWSCIPK